MKLSDKTLHELDAEYQRKAEAIQDQSDIINAHQEYAEEHGEVALCSAVLGIVTVWVKGNVKGLALSDPFKMIASRPAFVAEYKGYKIYVVTP